MVSFQFLFTFLPVLWQLSFLGNSPENYAVANIPAALMQDADVIIRRYDTNFEILNTSEATQKVTYVCTILNKNAADEARLLLPYSKLIKINSIKGTLYNKNGQEIQKLKQKDIYDLGGLTSNLIDDNRIKVANLESVEFPFTVAYEYELAYTGSLFYPTWQPQEKQNFAVQKATFQVSVPKNGSFRYKPVNGASEPFLTKIGNAALYSWSVSGLAAFEEQPFQPALAEITPVVYTAPNNFSIENVDGNMNSWAEFGNWINQLNKGRATLPPATISEVKNLVSAEPDELAKIRKLYAYMQNKTRYVSVQLGLGGWQPFEAAFVDAKGYGDCKALTNYMYSLLQAAGINSHYTLIRAGEDAPEVLKDFPSNQFNHAILCVPTAKDTVWLECTSQTGSWGYNGIFTGNRNALLITPQGGKLVRTTIYGPEKNLQNRKATINLDAEGNASALLNTTYTGLQQDEVRMVMHAEIENQKKWLNRQIGLPNFLISEFKFNARDGYIPEVTENLNIQVNKYATQSGKRFFLNPNFNNRFSVPDLKKTERKLPIVIDMPFIDSDEITYQLPAGTFQAENLMEPVHFKSSFGEYKASCRIEGDKLIYSRSLKMVSGRFSASNYAELSEFCKKITAADKSQVVLVSKT